MPRIPRARIRAALARADIRGPGQSAADHRQRKGRALEDVVCDILGRVPGFEVARRNVVNVAGTEEVDILFWNRWLLDDFYHLETPFLVECKNWETPIPAREIVNFSHLLEMRACRDGIRVSARPLDGHNALVMMKRRARAIGLSETTCGYSSRAAGITAHPEDGGTNEASHRIPAPESSKTSELHHRTGGQVTPGEVERIVIE